MRKFLLIPAVALVLAWSSLAAAGGSPSGPPPTPVPPYGSPSPFPTALATPKPAQHPPRISAVAAVLEDLDTGQVLYARHLDRRRAIASLTKIMTAIVVLHRASPGDVVKVSAEAASLGSENVGLSELGVQRGERLTVRQLLYAMLLQSANDAAVALADDISPSTAAFVGAMNREARRDGFSGTKFYSPNGLDDRGYSTARSLAGMTRLAERSPLFARIVRTKFHVVPAPPGGAPRRIQNRNVLLWLYPHATGAKTGYTGKAGFCLVATARLSGAHFVAVVLGDTSSEASFADAASLLTYGFHALVRSRVISKGARLPPARVDGLEYPLAAAKALRAWVPADAGRPGVRIHLPSTRSTPRVGDRMGTAVLSLRGRVLGRVPAVVSGVPHVAPPPVPRETSTPWWQRGIDTVNRAADGLFHTIFG